MTCAMPLISIRAVYQWRGRAMHSRVATTGPSGLVELLDLEEIERNIFRGRNESGMRERLFGGQVAAQALAAAGRTVDGRAAHSLHAYFLRPGDPRLPVLYTVDRIRDGQSFATRRVVAVQRGQAIFSTSVSFQVHERGYEHQQLEMPAAPDPESLDRKSTRLNSSHVKISYAVFC